MRDLSRCSMINWALQGLIKDVSLPKTQTCQQQIVEQFLKGRGVKALRAGIGILSSFPPQESKFTQFKRLNVHAFNFIRKLSFPAFYLTLVWGEKPCPQNSSPSSSITDYLLILLLAPNFSNADEIPWYFPLNSAWYDSNAILDNDDIFDPIFSQHETFFVQYCVITSKDSGCSPIS